MRFWLPAWEGFKSVGRDLAEYSYGLWVSFRDIVVNLACFLSLLIALPFIPFIRNYQALKSLVRDIRNRKENLEKCGESYDFAKRVLPIVKARLAVFPYSSTYQELESVCVSTIEAGEEKIRQDLDELKREIENNEDN